MLSVCRSLCGPVNGIKVERVTNAVWQAWSPDLNCRTVCMRSTQVDPAKQRGTLMTNHAALSRRGLLEHFTIRLTISRTGKIGRTLRRREVSETGTYNGP